MLIILWILLKWIWFPIEFLLFCISWLFSVVLLFKSFTYKDWKNIWKEICEDIDALGPPG